MVRVGRYNSPDYHWGRMLVDDYRDGGTFSEEEKLAANEQLERLLANPFFSHSRRFPSFLRFIVSQTLLGRTDLLKERTLGIEVFGKSANYDTANDPIVRVTAAEIRKRIAQYYQDPAHEHELRLSLPPGSYVPKFDPPHGVRTEEPHSTLLTVHGVLESPTTGSLSVPHVGAAAPAKHGWTTPVLTSVVLLLMAVGGWLWWQSSQTSALMEFWAPVLNSSDPVLFCIADQTQYTAISLRDAQDPSKQQVLHDNLTAVVIDDLTPLVKMHTLGSTFIPPGIHAGGLRYHGMAPLVSHVIELGLADAVTVQQLDAFAAGIQFARAEGIVPAPESNHAIAEAIRQALSAKEEGKPRTILFNLSGHGHFDMQSYIAYQAGQLENYEYPAEEIAMALAGLPAVG